jgi:hypothetical protein
MQVPIITHIVINDSRHSSEHRLFQAAGRVLRVRGSSFLEKTCLGTPKKRQSQKKCFSLQLKRKGTHAPCSCSSCRSKVKAAGRVLRVRGSSFQEKTRRNSPREIVLSEKIFSFQLKEKKRKVARASHAVAPPKSIKRVLRDEFCDCRAAMRRLVGNQRPLWPRSPDSLPPSLISLAGLLPSSPLFASARVSE